MDFEKLGAFYLGKEYDTAARRLLDRPVMYDARDLTTHAVCVGMTGSGKTGLCIDLLEEAALDGVPAIIIDPKGDIANLLLAFPDLKPADFLPWVNADDARRKNLTPEQFASQQAGLWKKGLADWGQDGQRIARMKAAADFTIYTPGSDAGLPVSILQSFKAPREDWSQSGELIRERIQGTVSALLGLVSIDADPLRSREHILLATIFEHFWRQGSDLDLPALIMAIQTPPVRKMGVFDVDTFFPPKERFELAMALNGIIAAPGFASWLQGQPLDVTGFLASPDGRCRHSIFSIAHLSDAERMFFITMLLNQVITWMRSQPGTTSLRALLYIDEIFGFFPPVANPPSKRPLLTLLKQARAYGLGTVLTTQNPVDLDYKGLSNAGTWFIGRLQTEQDKARLLDGLESAAAGADTSLNKEELSRRISDLGKRVFLLHNVHEEGPITFQTRWAMSYLRGPLTRLQIRELMRDRKIDEPGSAPIDETPLKAAAREPLAATPRPAAAAAAGAPPHLPPGIRQGFLPLRVTSQAAALVVEGEGGGALEILSRRLLYRPAVMSAGQVHFIDRKRRVNETEPFCLLTPPPTLSGSLDWREARGIDLPERGLAEVPEEGAAFDSLPGTINEAREFKALEKDLKDYLYRSSALELLYAPTAKLYSRPSEKPQDFNLRLRQSLREMRDRDVDKLRRRYAGRTRRLGNTLRKAEETLARRRTVAKSRKSEVLVSLGESLLGVFMGRRSTRSASTTMSKYRQSKTAAMSIAEAEEAVARAQKEIAAIEEELQAKVEEMSADWEEAAGRIEKVPVTPRRSDIDVDFFGLAWVPYWQVTSRDREGRQRSDDAPAF
jgi:hypothetical protein